MTIDPLIIFFCCYYLNVDMPSGRLSVKEVIAAKEKFVQK